MKLATMKSALFGLGSLAIALSIIVSGLMLAPNSASAFWWPWGNHHVYAQSNENDENDDPTVTVTVQKYIDGALATSESADGNAFPITTSWDDPDGAGEGSAAFELSAETSPAYQAVSTEFETGADYSISEVLDGDVVSASCDNEQPYALVGYSIGTSTELAEAANVSDEAPALTDLTENQYVIVWNESCDDDTNDNATSSGSISGEVTGGASEENPGDLAVTSVDAQKTTAIANGEFADGWQYVFNITVPEDEPNLAMKFADWMQTEGDHTIPVAGNMRISSEQSDNASSTVTLTGADTYSSPELTMIGDLDTEEDGLQVQVLVEVAVPSDTFNGTYSTEYGVRTLP